MWMSATGSFGESSVKLPFASVCVAATGTRSGVSDTSRARRASDVSGRCSVTRAPLTGCPSPVMTIPVIAAAAGRARRERRSATAADW
jgi:hypothetical protein